MGDNLRSSTLGLVFQISRVLGVAPVTFTRSNVYLSRRLQISSIIFFTAINCMLIVGLVFDFKAESCRSIRLESNSSSLVWIANLTIIMLVSAVGVYYAPCRIECVTKVLAAINKMKRRIEDHKLNNKNVNFDLRLRLTCMFLILSNIGLVLSDIYNYTDNTIKDDREVRVLILYMGFYYEFLCFTLFECQFIVIACEVQDVLANVTKSLEDLLSISATQARRKQQFSALNRNYLIQTAGNVISINNFIDNKSAGVLYADKYSERLETLVHDLATVFGDACDLMREVDSGFGLQLLFILMCFFLELIVTPYYLMTALFTMDRGASYPVLQVLWALYHLVSMFSVVEPAYLTQLEIEKTGNLIRRYLCRVKPYEPVYAELELFMHQLVFHRPTYSPMGVCTLSRQLCVSVLGAVTTYLVIILQFRASEK